MTVLALVQRLLCNHLCNHPQVQPQTGAEWGVAIAIGFGVFPYSWGARLLIRGLQRLFAGRNVLALVRGKRWGDVNTPPEVALARTASGNSARRSMSGRTASGRPAAGIGGRTASGRALSGRTGSGNPTRVAAVPEPYPEPFVKTVS
jgi:hypothetical protein